MKQYVIKIMMHILDDLLWNEITNILPYEKLENTIEVVKLLHIEKYLIISYLS